MLRAVPGPLSPRDEYWFLIEKVLYSRNSLYGDKTLTGADGFLAYPMQLVRASGALLGSLPATFFSVWRKAQ